MLKPQIYERAAELVTRSLNEAVVWRHRLLHWPERYGCCAIARACEEFATTDQHRKELIEAHTKAFKNLFKPSDARVDEYWLGDYETWVVNRDETARINGMMATRRIFALTIMAEIAREEMQ